MGKEQKYRVIMIEVAEILSELYAARGEDETTAKLVSEALNKIRGRDEE